MSPDTAIPGLKVDGHSLIRCQCFSIDVLCCEQVLGVDAVGLVERNLPVVLSAGNFTFRQLTQFPGLRPHTTIASTVHTAHMAAIMADSMTSMYSFMGSSLRTPAAFMIVSGMFYSQEVKIQKSTLHVR